MNKIIIPTILTATILIAGLFAFMPVQQASTVHTTILAGTSQVRAVAEAAVDVAAAPGTTLTLTCNAPFDVLGFTVVQTAGTNDNTAAAAVADQDGAAAAFAAAAIPGGAGIGTAAMGDGEQQSFTDGRDVAAGGTASVTITDATVVDVDSTTVTWFVLTSNSAVCS